MAIFTIFIFFATVAYAVIALFQWCAMKESNHINRESLQSVQRADVYYAGIRADAVHRPDGGFTWEMSCIWENGGPTRAKNAISTCNIASLTDEEFRNIDFKVDPHSIKTIGSINHGLPFYVGYGDEPPNFGADIKNGFHVVYWGWVGYRDIFEAEGTKPHVTEFCVELNEVKGPLDAHGKTITSQVQIVL